ncbi:MAG: VCBS repeat-containing protein, partial [Candidatus Marinimicrobia bacterium]|nr:VCBS repeat-containing protein [Candidatus Neomarinimicrobiota bacterium]
MNLPKWSITLLLFAFAVFAMAGGNGVNSYTLGWSETSATDGDVYWGVSGPFDYDADGFDEIVAFTDDGGITLHMFENDGNDAWTEVWTHTISDIVYSYEVANEMTDLDRDGIPEMLVAGEAGSGGDYPNSLFIFELDTSATEIAFTQVAAVNPAEVADIANGDGVYATSVKTIVANDLDADGVTELLIYDGRASAVIVMSLDTNSTYEFPNWVLEFSDESFCCSVYGGAVIGDFDANGTNNFAMVQWNFDEISFFDVVGVNEYELIQFVEGVTTYDGGSKRGIASADLNGDGYTEIYLASTEGNVVVYDIGADLADFDGTTDVYEIYVGLEEFSFRGAQLGNTDIWHGSADGADFIITTDSTVMIDLEYDGVGAVTDAASWTPYMIPNETSTDEWQDVVLGDFDYDGLDEIFAVTRSTATVQVYEHDGWDVAGVTSSYASMADTLLSPGFQTRGIAAGSDLDNDGLYEIIITDYQIHGVHVYEATGD